MDSQPDTRPLTASDAVAARIKEARARRGWSAKQLAEQCAARGASSLTHAVLNNIESGRPDTEGQRRRDISVDEVFTLALVLDVAPAHLMTLPANSSRPLEVAPGCQVARSEELQMWVRGDGPLPQTDERLYYASALEQLPARDDSRTTTEFARSVLQDRAKKLLDGFHAETERLAASTAARLEAIVSEAEEAVAGGASSQEVIDLLRRADRDDDRPENN